jgi:hypothetical protein
MIIPSCGACNRGRTEALLEPYDVLERYFQRFFFQDNREPIMWDTASKWISQDQRA